VRGTRRAFRHPYRGTTRHLQSVYPFMADAGLGGDGVVIGRDGLRRTFCYDPFVLYRKGKLNGPNMLILGDIGYGKSSLTKSFLYRQVCFGYTPLVTDVKGEYDRLCEALEVNPIRFVSGGSLRLNPLDAKIGGQARLTLLRSIAELLLGRQLYPREGAALEQAYEEVEVAARRRRRQPCIPELAAQLLRPTQDGARALEASVADLQEWGRDVAFSLRRLVTGDLAGMFDDETSPGLDLDGRMASVNLRQVTDAAKPILMACVSAWLKSVWGRDDGRRRIVVQEEAWHLLKSPAFAEMQQENFKLARQYGVQNIIVMHHLGDLKAAGDAGSRTAELAQNLLADAATRVLYHLDEGELHATAELLGLNRAQCRVIPKLYRASGLWVVGGHSFVVHHRLAPPPSPERWIVDTDGAMLGRGAEEASA
jgi:type IV secretory pathway VirB4 component